MSKTKKITKLAEAIIKKIPENKRGTNYAVESGAYNDPRKNVYLVGPDIIKKKFKGVVSKSICFNYGIREQLKDKGLTRAYARIGDCSTSLPKITTKEKRQWIKLAKKHNLLPRYVKVHWADKGKYVFKLNVKGMSPSLLYSYLSTTRYFRDEAGFVKGVLTMVDHGVNYYLAFVLASKMYIHNTSHHIVSIGRGYPHALAKTTKEVLETNLEVGIATALKRYFDDPGKWDKRSVHDLKTGWGCHNMIKSAYKTNKTVKASELFNSSIIKTVMGD